MGTTAEDTSKRHPLCTKRVRSLVQSQASVWAVAPRVSWVAAVPSAHWNLSEANPSMARGRVRTLCDVLRAMDGLLHPNMLAVQLASTVARRWSGQVSVERCGCSSQLLLVSERRSITDTF